MFKVHRRDFDHTDSFEFCLDGLCMKLQEARASLFAFLSFHGNAQESWVIKIDDSQNESVDGSGAVLRMKDQ
jgi:hypothetical protein